MKGDLAKVLDDFSDSPRKGGPEEWFVTFKKRRKEGASSTAELKRRAIQNHEFAAPGEEQLPYEGNDSGSRGRRKRKFALMSANEVHPVLSTMSGRQVMGRFERRYIPRRRELRSWGEKLSAYDRAVVDACHADQEESSAFRNGPGIAGVSWMRVSVDYLEDPEGKIVIEEVPLWNMLWPAKEARKKNLLDRDWQIHGEWYTIGKFKALWPNKVAAVRGQIGKSPAWDAGSSAKAEGSSTPWDGLSGSSWTEETEYSFFDPKEKQIWIERYERREPQVRFFVMLPPEGMSYADAEAAIAAGEAPAWSAEGVQEMSPEEFRRISRENEADFGEEIPPNRYIRKERMIYSYAYIAGEVVLEKGEIPVERLTYEAETGYPYTKPQSVTWRSVVDSMRTPQIWYNIFLTMLVKYMQVNPKGVLFVERGVFRNRAEGLKQFSSTGGLVEVERGKLSGGGTPPFKFETGGTSPMGGFVQGMLGFAQELLPRSAGFNQGALGQLGPDLRRISGTVIEHVREAAVAAHAELYDSHALCRQRVGLLLLATLSKVLGIDHMKRVVGDEAFLEDILDPATGEGLIDPQVLQQLIEGGAIPEEDVVPPAEIGDPFMRRIEPPEGLLDDAVWAVAVEETKPAPERMRFFWESATESGGLDRLMTPDSMGVQAFTAGEIAEMVPDIPEDLRKRALARIKKQRAAFAAQQAAAAQAAQQAPPPGGEGLPVQ